MTQDSSETLAQADQPLEKKLLGILEHDQRLKLHNELHVGTRETLAAPTQLSHLVLICNSNLADEERRLLAQLCQRYDVTPPSMQSTHFSADMGSFRFKWERHTEYSTYTVYQNTPFDAPFAEAAVNHLPKEWLESLPGKLMVAVNVAIEPKDRRRRDLAELSQLFASNTVIGSEVAAGRAVVWTDNQIHTDGFGRILIHDVNLRSRQAGRLVQRLLEIETYRMLAMLPVPLTRKFIPQLAGFDRRLAELTATNNKLDGVADEQQLLEELSQLASEIEAISAQTSHRFNASKAYFNIVTGRVRELRERRIEGLQMFHEFMDQRLTSAMGTCNLVHDKLETLSTRVERASALLRTRVDITMEEQSRDLLKSMDRRADLQLRLQKTVEGLSVVVLSYYLLGLVAYGLKGLKASGVELDTEFATGLAIPIVLGIVFIVVRRIHHSVDKEDH